MMRRLASLVVVFCLLESSRAAAPRKVLAARYPVAFRDVSKTPSLALGASSLEIDLSKTDLELVIWKVDKGHALEVNIDVKNVNQSVLETDALGKLLPKVTELGAVPWIKVYLPSEAPRILDVTCFSSRNICQGVWKGFPYDASKENVIKIEANLRGLEGKVWSPVINSHRLAGTANGLEVNSAVLTPPYKLRAEASPARVRISVLYDLLRMSSAFATLKLLSVSEWDFLNDETLRETGFLRTLHKTLFQADRGQFLLDTLSQSTLQTQDMPTGRAFFAEKGTALSLSSRKTRESPESTLRILEFE